MLRSAAAPRSLPKGLLSDEFTEEQQGAVKQWLRAHHWSPNQLRHNAATHIRKEFGLDAARVILGHSSPAVTEVYAELDQAKAMEIMGKIG